MLTELIIKNFKKFTDALHTMRKSSPWSDEIPPVKHYHPD